MATFLLSVEIKTSRLTKLEHLRAWLQRVIDVGRLDQSIIENRPLEASSRVLSITVVGLRQTDPSNPEPRP